MVSLAGGVVSLALASTRYRIELARKRIGRG
jgi:hypothetical protein